jgi:hypothetical protein
MERAMDLPPEKSEKGEPPSVQGALRQLTMKESLTTVNNLTPLL